MGAQFLLTTEPKPNMSKNTSHKASTAVVTPTKGKKNNKEKTSVVSPVKKLAALTPDPDDFTDLDNPELLRIIENIETILDTRDCVPQCLRFIVAELGKEMTNVCDAVRHANGRIDGELVESVYAIAMHILKINSLKKVRGEFPFKVGKRFFEMNEIDDCFDTVFKPNPDNGIDLFHIDYKNSKYIFHYIQIKHGMTQIGYAGGSSYSLIYIRRRLHAARKIIEKWFPICRDKSQYEYQYHLYALGGVCETARNHLKGGANATPIQLLAPSKIKKMLLSVMRDRLGEDRGNLDKI